MKKSKQSEDSPLTVKFTLAMRLTAIVVLTMCLQLYTRIACAQHSLITLSLKDAPLDMVIMEIRNQTGTNFLYDIEWLKKARPVTIQIKDAPLLTALDSCFANQPFTYAVTGRIVTIIPKDHFQKLIGPDLIEVAGTVINTDEIPLEGATVRVKGTTKGISTDADGNFILKDIDKSAVLEVSYIGYSSQVIKVKSKVYIRLEENPMSLDAAETKGITSVIRRYNLSPTKKITSGEISIQPFNNILAALQGRVTGVEAVQQSGLPGSGFNILIRGQKSIGMTAAGALPSNSPLFIVDGVPFLTSAESLTQTSLIMANTPFSTINPEDIESIEILKDANATSIYGLMGANGVILITTRKPKGGNTTIDVKMKTGWGKVARTMDYMNTQQYLEMRREAFTNDGMTPTMTNAKDLLLWDTTRYTDWKKELIGGIAHFSSAHIRVSGGSERTNFTTSFGYNKESTVFPGDFGKSLMSLGIQLAHASENKKLELLLVGSYGYDKSHLPRTDLTGEIEFIAPNTPDPFDEQGRLVFQMGGEKFYNPYTSIFQPYKNSMARFTGSVKLSYKILPSLQFRSNIGYNYISGSEHLAITIASQDPVLNPKGSANFGQNKNRNWLTESQLELTRSIGKKGILKTLAGISFREQTASKQLNRASDYQSDDLIELLYKAPKVVSSGESKTHKLQSVYSLINYTFDRKYVIELTGRRDGSSQFGPDKRFGNFGSIATGWLFSNENFIKKTFPFISFGKIRMSHGITGVSVEHDYVFLDRWDSTQYPYGVTGYTPTRTYNNDLAWELHRITDIGIDIGFLSDRIVLSATWNQSKTSNQRISVAVPSQTGFISVIKNSSVAVGNKSFELEIYTVNARKSNFRWNTSLNLTISRNKLLYFPDFSTSAYSNFYIIGQPLNFELGYRTQGVDLATGVYQILDKNGNVIPIPNRFPADSDRVKTGSYNPVYYGGLQNSVQFGNWRLDILFQFVKQKGLNNTVLQARSAGFLGLNQTTGVLDRWQKPGDNAFYQRYTQNVASTAYLSGIFRTMSDALITDASYVRLKTLSLSYNLPVRWIEKLKMKNCSLLFQAQNLLTFTSYKGGHDPESGSVNPTGLPPLKIFSFGIQASF